MNDFSINTKNILMIVIETDLKWYSKYFGINPMNPITPKSNVAELA